MTLTRWRFAPSVSPNPMAEKQESKPLTVQELIERLQRFGPNLTVMTYVCRDEEGRSIYSPLLVKEADQRVDLAAFRRGGTDEEGQQNWWEDDDNYYTCKDDSEQAALRAVLID